MKKRDGFNNLISDAMSGQFDRILVKSISRFARNTVDTLQTIRMLKDAGVSVFFEKENMDNMDLKSEFVLTIMSSLAQEESISISKNVKWGLRQTYAKGNAHAPYAFLLGYKAKPGEKHTLVIDKEQAKYVRLIYRLFLEGYSEHYIAKYLKDSYNMHGDANTDKRINTLLSGLEKKVSAISEMRNKDSDAHGVGASRITIDEHHARLFVNAAMAMADFILSVEKKAHAK